MAEALKVGPLVDLETKWRCQGQPRHSLECLCPKLYLGHPPNDLCPGNTGRDCLGIYATIDPSLRAEAMPAAPSPQKPLLPNSSKGDSAWP